MFVEALDLILTRAKEKGLDFAAVCTLSGSGQ